jgi:glutaconate CoA-transferase subunit B
MQVLALHPGVSLEQVRDNTSFDVLDHPGRSVTEPPSELELSVLRELDPAALYIS